MTTASIDNPLPAIRRVVTSHDERGEATIMINEIIKKIPSPGGEPGVSFGVPWTTDSAPADCQTSIDGATLPMGELTNEGGSVVRYVDMPPGLVSPMHRTVSLDYGFVLFGKVELVLPDGTRVAVNPGDIVVQRGTDHAWANASQTEWARMVYVLLPSKPVVIGGQELGAISLKERR